MLERVRENADALDSKTAGVNVNRQGQVGSSLVMSRCGLEKRDVRIDVDWEKTGVLVNGELQAWSDECRQAHLGNPTQSLLRCPRS